MKEIRNILQEKQKYYREMKSKLTKESTHLMKYLMMNMPRIGKMLFTKEKNLQRMRLRSIRKAEYGSGRNLRRSLRIN